MAVQVALLGNDIEEIRGALVAHLESETMWSASTGLMEHTLGDHALSFALHADASTVGDLISGTGGVCADVIVCVFSLASLASFTAVGTQWLQPVAQARCGAPIVLAGVRPAGAGAGAGAEAGAGVEAGGETCALAYEVDEAAVAEAALLLGAELDGVARVEWLTWTMGTSLQPLADAVARGALCARAVVAARVFASQQLALACLAHEAETAGLPCPVTRVDGQTYAALAALASAYPSLAASVLARKALACDAVKAAAAVGCLPRALVDVPTVRRVACAVVTVSVPEADEHVARAGALAASALVCHMRKINTVDELLGGAVDDKDSAARMMQLVCDGVASAVAEVTRACVPWQGALWIGPAERKLLTEAVLRAYVRLTDETPECLACALDGTVRSAAERRFACGPELVVQLAGQTPEHGTAGDGGAKKSCCIQ